jgi:hypothetical protein
MADLLLPDTAALVASRLHQDPSWHLWHLVVKIGHFLADDFQCF